MVDEFAAGFDGKLECVNDLYLAAILRPQESSQDCETINESLA
jgi:hypothetical protein